MVLVLLLDFEYSRNIFELDKVGIKSNEERMIFGSLNGSNFHVIILKLQTVTEVFSRLSWLTTFLDLITEYSFTIWKKTNSYVEKTAVSFWKPLKWQYQDRICFLPGHYQMWSNPNKINCGKCINSQSPPTLYSWLSLHL